MKKIIFGLAILLGLVNVVPALAQVDASVDATVSVKLTAAEEKARTRGDQEIDRRVSALNDLNARVGAMQKISEQFKQSLSATVQAQVGALTTLKAKIDADTDSATLKSDVKSITEGYRVFALLIPQGRIAAAGDRVVTIASMMNTMGTKLQARLQAAAQAGADVTALTAALTDLSAKLTDAQNQAQTGVTASASLEPDQGDAAKMKSNTEALKGARTNLQTATKDLQAARKDIETIVKGLSTLKVNTQASSTTQVQTQ